MKIRTLGLATLFALLPHLASAQQWVDIGTGTANAMEMGSGERALILVHGHGGHAGSWFKSDYSEFGRLAANSGLRVLSIGWSGTPGHAADSEIDKARAYLTSRGATRISLGGYSAGGGAAAMHARARPDGTFHSVLQFSSVDDKPINLEKTRKIFAYNLRDRCCGHWQSRASKSSSEPKDIFELSGSGHPIPTLVKEKPDLLASVISRLQ